MKILVKGNIVAQHGITWWEVNGGISVIPEGMSYNEEDYDVIITGCSINRLIAAKNIWNERILPDFFPSNGPVSIAKILLDVPITVYELYPAEDALELRRKLMEAGLTVKLKGVMGYLSRYEFMEYNKHQKDQLSSLPLVPDL